MKFTKIALAQGLLRGLQKKQIMLPLAVGAGVVAGAHTVGTGLQKGREYKAGFTPGNIPQEH